MFYYSASTNAFYGAKFPSGKLPSDVVEISDEMHKELIIAQSTGSKISADGDGNPIFTKIERSFDDWLDNVVRPRRDAKMDEFDLHRVNRCRRQIDQGQTPDDDLSVLLAYMQDLADFPTTLTEIVDQIPWPAEP